MFSPPINPRNRDNQSAGLKARDVPSCIAVPKQNPTRTALRKLIFPTNICLLSSVSLKKIYLVDVMLLSCL